MIFLKGIYDSSSKRMIIEFKANLIENYFNILEDCVKNKVLTGYLPQGMEVKKIDTNKCHLIFGIKIPEAENLKNGSRIEKLPDNISEKISEVLEEFKLKAMEQEFKVTEFIPLSGYPVEQLQKEVVEAVKNKRNFCIVDKYSEYLKFSKGISTSLKQKQVNYIDNEYSDVAIYLYEGKIKTLKERYEKELSSLDWMA